METPAPTLEEFRRLYETAIAFKQDAPWEWMTEDKVFGIRDPETGQIGYASISKCPAACRPWTMPGLLWRDGCKNKLRFSFFWRGIVAGVPLLFLLKTLTKV